MRRARPGAVLVVGALCALAAAAAACGTAPPASGQPPRLHVAAGQTVNGVFSLGRPVDLQGRAREDVSVIGADATIGPGGVVGGNVTVVGGLLHVAPGARIGGLVIDLNLASGQPAEALGVAGFWAAWALLRLLLTLAVFALALLAAALVPRWVALVGERTRANPWAMARVGLWSIILGLLVTIVLAATLIGLPVAAGLALAYAVATAFGLAGVGYWLGDAAAQRLGVDWPGGVRKVALGLGAILAASFVPLLGPLLLAIASLVAFGAAMTSLHAWVRRA